MEISPPFWASPPFTPFHPFVSRVGVKECACIKSSMLGKDNCIGNRAGGEWVIFTCPENTSTFRQLPIRTRR